jgi:glycosyltransferase involved in cell wall biosynthesis
MDQVELSVVIPFYNEGENVILVMDSIIAILKDTGISFEIIPLDNGSVDGTGHVIRQNYNCLSFVKIVTVEINQGLGWGLLQGFRASQGKLICYFGGDGQTDPRDVLRSYQWMVKHEDLDMVVAKRVRRADGLLRKFMSVVFNKVFELLFRTGVSDINGTPKIFRASLLKEIQLKSTGWFIDAELMLWVRKCNKKITEMPIIFNSRVHGKTHIDENVIWEFIKQMYFYAKKPL